MKERTEKMTTHDQIGACIGAAAIFNSLRLSILQLLSLGLIDGKTSDGVIQALQCEQAKIMHKILYQVSDVPWLQEFVSGMVQGGFDGEKHLTERTM